MPRLGEVMVEGFGQIEKTVTFISELSPCEYRYLEGESWDNYEFYEVCTQIEEEGQETCYEYSYYALELDEDSEESEADDNE